MVTKRQLPPEPSPLRREGPTGTRPRGVTGSH